MLKLQSTTLQGFLGKINQVKFWFTKTPSKAAPADAVAH